MSKLPLAALLKKSFGFDSFRPHQQEIIDAALAGRDVFALLPTGGGKSLCYQLPALAKTGLTLVVSPLIALMKDQVDSLQTSGIPATFLNSSLGAVQARERWRDIEQGRIRLLYVSPERALMDGFSEALKRWQPHLLAIDEAHCISEWGHDFRPEYRQIAALRELLPETPVMALTATATPRVREDIIEQLQLRDPAVIIGDFNRPNLVYRVAPKSRIADQVAEYLRERPHEAGIVYCQSRKATESLADALQSRGIAARPYHAGLGQRERSENQELFLRDDVRVICATIAFGMGINKSNVRFVIHADLPKNMEGYYQETGRAGRDGVHADCLLLFSPGDVVKYRRFIDEKPDPHEREIAHRQLRQMVHFAENSSCRRRVLLDYFGQAWDEASCPSSAGCDNCLTPRETYDGTRHAQMLLSCVIRIRQANRFGTGLGHVTDVLVGAQTANIRKWKHEQLTTYGIGNDLSKAAWMTLGRELIRMGLLVQTDPHQVVELTPEGAAILKERKPIHMTRPMVKTKTPPAQAPPRKAARAGDISCDETLFEKLRVLRRKMADSRSVPAYMIFSDASLRQMARIYPSDADDFAAIPGVGAQKLADFAEPFLEAIQEHLQSAPRQSFLD